MLTLSRRLRCAANSANVLNLFFTNEIIYPTITRPLHDPFCRRARGSARTGEFERDSGDVRRATPGGRALHQAKLNEEVSKKFLQTYLEMLDFSHLFFTQEDVDAITAKYSNAMAGDVLMGTLKPAYEIYALYTKRVDERVAKIKELLKQSIDFKSNATVELSRQKSPWPKNEAEADQLWRGRIANELLQEHLSEHPIEPAPQLVSRRYDRLGKSARAGPRRR